MIYKLRPGEKQILKVLETEELSFEEIKKRTGLSRPVISDYLKGLWKKDLIVRDIDTRKYRIIEKGARALLEHEIFEKTSSAPQLYFEEDLDLDSSQKKIAFPLDVEFSAFPLSEKQPKIKGFLYFDEGHKNNIQAIEGALDYASLRTQITLFFHTLGESLAKAYGCKNADIIPSTWRDQNYDTRNEVIREKTELDVDATLVLHFAGREFAKTIDWERILKAAEEHDKKCNIIKRYLKEAVKKKKELQKTYLEQYMRLTLNHIQSLNKHLNKWQVGDDVSELEKEFVRHIRALMLQEGFPKVPSEKEIKEMLDTWKKEGILDVKSVYTFKVNEEKLKMKDEEITSILKEFFKSHVDPLFSESRC